MQRKAFTLIELLIYMAVFAIVIVGFVTIFVSMLRIQSQQSSQTQVEQEGQFLIQQIQYYVESARLVDMSLDTATGTLQLREFSLSNDPTLIYATNGIVYIRQGSGVPGTPTPLTSSNVTISQLSFTRHYNFASSTASGADSISFSFTMGFNVSNTLQQYTGSFESAATVLAPVGKIALIQKATNATTTTSTTITATYGSSNEAGDLLLAVVGNAGTTSVSIVDSASNTWNKIVSLPYNAYSAEMTVFDATNAIATSTNIVTSTFGAAEGSSSIFLYEYRGVATSSSFDASSSQLQPNTQTPSSGLANATSAVELVFGAIYDASTTEVPAAGLGFTAENSSTISSVFTEDQDIYITDPVAATWQYSVTTPSSSALVVTFH